MLLKIKLGKGDALATVIPAVMHRYSSSGVPCKIGGWADSRREYMLDQQHLPITKDI